MIVVPELWQIILEIVVGAVCGKLLEQFKTAIVGAAVIAFLLSIISFLFGNPDSLNDLNTVSEKIAVVMTALVTFVMHAVFFEIGTIPTNLITNQRHT